MNQEFLKRVEKELEYNLIPLNSTELKSPCAMCKNVDCKYNNPNFTNQLMILCKDTKNGTR